MLLLHRPVARSPRARTYRFLHQRGDGRQRQSAAEFPVVVHHRAQPYGSSADRPFLSAGQVYLQRGYNGRRRGSLQQADQYGTATQANFFISTNSSGTNPVSGVVSLLDGGQLLRFKPTSALSPSTYYYVFLTNNIQDTTGLNLQAGVTPRTIPTSIQARLLIRRLLRLPLRRRPTARRPSAPTRWFR